jgi:LmbE family N-acetylglucosaminyl deacetylase
MKQAAAHHTHRWSRARKQLPCRVSCILRGAFVLIGLLIVFSVPPLHAQGSARGDSLVLVYLSAHPDDEGGATLASSAKLKGVRTYSIFFTRGEGGQNETGSSLYDDLGILRTQETLRAAEILGTTAIFLGFPDFGYSKTARETFARWGGKDTVLARLVFYIRALQPDVIITNHDTVTTPPRRQHGNHQAVGITAYEAFEKAADPSFHPEQLRGGLHPWQPKKLFFRVSRADSSQRDSVTNIDIQARTPDGSTVENIAVRALAMHRSQGMEKIQSLSAPRYRLIRTDGAYPFSPTDLFAGIRPSHRSPFPLEDARASIPRVSLEVSPSCIPAGYAHQVFTVSFLNRSGKPCRAFLRVFSSSKELLRRQYLLSLDRLDDTLAADLPPAASPADDSLNFWMNAVVGDEKLSTSFIIHRQRVAAKYSPDATIGLVATYDNTLLETLRSFGIRHSLLDSSELSAGNLDRYSVILIDLRAYRFRPDAAQYAGRLLEYSRKGGNLVCFYHKPEDWNGKPYAPYPILLTTERVTEEDATVTVLLPAHRLFTTPNTMAGGDWAGWVQERSIDLPSADTLSTSAHYERLLAMSDASEHQPPTSLLWCLYGKGTYSYVSLALYRQLRTLNEGALKLFFNILSQPRR